MGTIVGVMIGIVTAVVVAVYLQIVLLTIFVSILAQKLKRSYRHTFGKSAQAAKDMKEFDSFLASLDDGFKRMQPKYINFDELIKIDAIKGSRPSLKITGLDIYGKPITKIIGTDVQTAKKLADDLGNITEEIITEIDVTNTIADQMRAAGMKNVQVF